MIMLLSSVMVYCLTMGVVNSWQSEQHARFAALLDYVVAAAAVCLLYYSSL